MSEHDDELRCCICGEPIEGHHANNPDPICACKNGVCCDSCDQHFVIPMRVAIETYDLERAGAILDTMDARHMQHDVSLRYVEDKMAFSLVRDSDRCCEEDGAEAVASAFLEVFERVRLYPPCSEAGAERVSEAVIKLECMLVDYGVIPVPIIRAFV